MKTEELRAIMDYLRKRVTLESPAAEDQADAADQPDAEPPINIAFAAPTEQEMIEAGLNAAGVKRLLSVPWWAEMVEDIEETPELCGPEITPQQALIFAQDVVSEYIRKRFPLDED